MAQINLSQSVLKLGPTIAGQSEWIWLIVINQFNYYAKHSREKSKSGKNWSEYRPNWKALSIWRKHRRIKKSGINETEWQTITRQGHQFMYSACAT